MEYSPNDPYGVGNWFGGDFANLTGDAWIAAVESTPVWNAVNNPNYNQEYSSGNPYQIGGYSTPTSSPSSPTTASTPPPSPTPPNPWITSSTYVAPTGVKQADPDIVLDPTTDTSGDYIVERFFEELGGTELISLSRYDLIDGIDVSYNPIANLSRLRRRFNPNNIIALDVLSDDEFSRFSIDLLSRGIYEPYFDDDGNLIIEVDIIRTEENIEAEISLSGTLNRIEL